MLARISIGILFLKLLYVFFAFLNFFFQTAQDKKCVKYLLLISIIKIAYLNLVNLGNFKAKGCSDCVIVFKNIDSFVLICYLISCDLVIFRL